MPSVNFERSLQVKADPATCWAVLTDVPHLVSWISIVDEAKEVSPLERYTAVLADRMGPFKLRADLEIVVSEVDEPNNIRVRAAGEDRQVSSRIAVDATLRLAPGDGEGTMIVVTGVYEVIGKVATLGAGMIRQKAAKVLDEFFDRASAQLGGD
jgi:carbon monoxide dehydrogenase subunit G